MWPSGLMLVLLSAPLLVAGRLQPTRTVRVGALLDNYNSQEEHVFLNAIEEVNSYKRPFVIEPVKEMVQGGNQLLVSLEMCQLLSMGVSAIFGPQSSEGAEMVQSICDTKDIPHIQTRFDLHHRRQDILVNLYPHPAALGKALAELVMAFKWTSFTIIYDDEDGLARVSSLLEVHQRQRREGKQQQQQQQQLYTVSIRRLDPGPDNRALLRYIKNSGDTNFVLDCNLTRLQDILTQMQQVGLMVADNSFIISNLDMHTLDMLPFSYGGCNITGLRLIDPTDPYVRDRLSGWHDEGEPLRTEALLMHDAVLLFAEAVRSLGHVNVSGAPLSCDAAQYGQHGHSLVNFMKSETSVRGFSGKLLFDTEGFRTNFVLDVVEVAMGEGVVKVGTFNSTLGLNLTRTPIEEASVGERALMNRTFVVLIALTQPYGMRKEKTTSLQGNDRYEGFGVDIFNELSKMLGFNYTLELQLDNKYGSKNDKTGEWNGMIRQIMDDKADLAITDLTITAEREGAVDFTMPFMSTGISILYKAPTKAPPKLFSFMDPFHIDVWMIMFVAYVGVSVLLFLMGRICPYEWTNPYPCIEEPETLENQFSLKNSFWFTIGSLMQQGSDIAPIAVSTRMVAGIWWFFTLIMVSSYTANLAAFLTVESLQIPFTSAYDLLDHPVIQYGAKSGGSTLNFFKDSNETAFQRMFHYMNSTPGVLPNSNEEGLEKVKKENYAFFMESAAIEFIVERHCEVQQYGGLLDSKGYGIAMKKGSPYRNILSTAVLKLQETGRLIALKDKWWKEERGGGVCAAGDSGGKTSGLKLENVGGVFVVLVAGIVMAILMTFIELLCSVCSTSRKEKVSFRKEFMEELRFISKFHGSTKPVRKYNQEDNLPLNPYPYGFVVDGQTVEEKDRVS